MEEAEYEVDEQGSDCDEDDSTRTTAAPPAPPAASSSVESNSESHQPRSPPSTTKLWKATRRKFETETSPEEQEWESDSEVIAHRSTTSESKMALKGIKLDLPETRDRNDDKWKNSERFDGCVNVL